MKGNEPTVGLPLPLRMTEMAVGLAALALGTVLMIRAGLGQSTGTAMLSVLSGITGVRVGTLMMEMFVLFILGQLSILKKNFSPRHAAQLAVAWIQGSLVNYFQYDCPPLQELHPSGYAFAWILLCIGLILMSFGSSAIICANLVQMPVEGFALVFSQRFEHNFGTVRQMIDVAWTALAVIGLLATGQPSTIREGTLFCVLVLGRSMNYTRRIICRAEQWFSRRFCQAGKKTGCSSA